MIALRLIFGLGALALGGRECWAAYTGETHRVGSGLASLLRWLSVAPSAQRVVLAASGVALIVLGVLTLAGKLDGPAKAGEDPSGKPAR